jgi:DNA replication protein DnaC
MSKPRREILEHIEASVAHWATLSPEEREEAHRQAELRELEARDRAERVDDAKLQGVLGEIRRVIGNLKPSSPEVLRRHRWATIGQEWAAGAGIPKLHRTLLEDWGNPSQEKTFIRTRDLCRGTGAVVALVGSRGTGKTTIATQVMLRRLEALVEYHYGPDRAENKGQNEPPSAGRYEKLTKLGVMFKAIFAGYGSIEQTKLTELYNNWVKESLLVIDEVHDAETIQPAMAMLVDLIDRRYAERRDTILISNRDAQTFRAEMNQSIISRLTETGAILSCEWQSWRTRK